MVSKQRRRKPFDRHTVIGSSSDLGPEWHKPADLQTFQHYSQLIDNLSSPDVTLEPKPFRPSISYRG